jgi:Uma2 family endonuclease
MAVEPALRQWTAGEYDRMIAAGILTKYDRVELIEGDIIEMSPIGSRHAACVMRLNKLLSKLTGEDAIISVQGPIGLNDYSEPQPDVALLRPRPDYYATSHPTPSDVLLLIEVADSSLMFDRDRKLPLYAAAGIAEAWIVDLVNDNVTVYAEPANESFEVERRFTRGQRIVSPALPNLLTVDDVIG